MWPKMETLSTSLGPTLKCISKVRSIFNNIQNNYVWHKAKARTTVIVHLSPNRNPADDNLIEIVIGGKNNTETYIRRGKGRKTDLLAEEQTNSLLSKNEFKKFWVSTKMASGNTMEVSVGKAGDSESFITALVDNPIEFKYLGLGNYNRISVSYKNVVAGDKLIN